MAEAKKSRNTSNASATGANRARGGLAQQVRPDADLARVIGGEPATRAEITKRVWAYVKSNDLQDAKDRRRINADDKLRPVFDGKNQVSMFEMTKLVNQHLK